MLRHPIRAFRLWRLRRWVKGEMKQALRTEFDRQILCGEGTGPGPQGITSGATGLVHDAAQHHPDACSRNPAKGDTASQTLDEMTCPDCLRYLIRTLANRPPHVAANNAVMRSAEEGAALDGVAFIAVVQNPDGKAYASALDPRRVLIQRPDGSMAESADVIAKASDAWAARGGPW